MDTLSRLHYSKSLFPLLLFPLSAIFFLIFFIRKYLYRFNFLKSFKLKVPVVIIGNITLGGTGKTPLIIHLAKELKKNGYHPGIVSRGYGSRVIGTIEVNQKSNINEVGLFNLSDFLPKQPTEADLKVIKEMFEASVDGQPYDPDRWAAYYKPYGLDVPEGATKAAETAPAPAVASAPAAEPEDDEVPAPTAPVAASAAPSSQRAEDILAMIRNRQKQ